MSDRLVLGSGSFCLALLESLAEWSGSVRVVTANDRHAGSLRGHGVAVEVVDPTDPAVLGRLDGVDVVVIADDSPATNRAAARAARRAFPEAYLLAYAADGDGDGTLAAAADAVVDPDRATTEYLLDRVGVDGERMRQLWRVLCGIEHLAVVAHDNPDPDAIASSVALERVAEAAGCEATVCYYGEITHHENRAFVNLLDIDMQTLSAEDDLAEFDGLALVDHSRPGVNNQLPETVPVDVVIDHHPPRTPVDARFVDLRSSVGATSTLLVDYLTHFGIGIDETVATALLFGIHVDTREFSREVSAADFEAAAALVAHADFGMLERIESPNVSASTLDTIASAVVNRRVEGEVLLSCVERISDRDAIAQAADRLLTLEDVTTTLVYGVMDGTIYVSARSRGSGIDIGETLRDAFGQIGSAGGHADMAGAQIALGVLEAVDDRTESLLAVVESVVTGRFLEAVEANTAGTVTGIYAETPNAAAEEYLVPGELPTGGDGDDAARSGAPAGSEGETAAPGGRTDGDRDAEDAGDDTPAEGP